MLSWQAMILNGFFRFTMKRHGKKPINLARLRAMTKNPPRSALAVPAGYTVESLRSPRRVRNRDHVCPRNRRSQRRLTGRLCRETIK
jgi:hypothetical protein